MSLAWATVALLVFLLPGFLFLEGMLLPERFARESQPRNPLALLATIVLISLVVHGTGLLSLSSRCSWGLEPICPRTDYLLAFFQLEGADSIPLERLASALQGSAGRILTYLLLTAGAGLISGWLLGKWIAEDRWEWRRLARHPWVFSIAPQGVTGRVEAHVLT